MAEIEGVVVIHGAGPHSQGDTLVGFVNSFLNQLRIKCQKVPSEKDYEIKDVSVYEDKDGEIEYIDVRLEKGERREGDEKLVRFREGFWSDAYVPHTGRRITRWAFDWARLITESRIVKKDEARGLARQRRTNKGASRKIRRQMKRGRDPRELTRKYKEKLERESFVEDFLVSERGKRLQNILIWNVLAIVGWLLYRILGWAVLFILLLLEVETTGNIMKYIDLFVTASFYVTLFLVIFGSFRIVFHSVLERMTGVRAMRFLSGLISFATGWLGLPVFIFMLGANLLGLTFYLVVGLVGIAIWHIRWAYLITYFGIDGRIFWSSIAGLAFAIWLLLPSSMTKKYKGIYYNMIADFAIPLGVPVAAFLFMLALAVSKIPLVGETLASTVRAFSDKMIVSFVGDVELYLEDDVQAMRILKRIDENTRGLFYDWVSDVQVSRDHEVSKIHIIAHSLGTMIAYEALAKTLDRDLVNKVVTFITMGSPLDKVRKLLEKRQGEYPRYDFDQLALPEDIRWVNLYALRDLVADRFVVNTPDVQYSVAEDVDILAAHGSYWEDNLSMAYIIQSILYPDETPLDRQWVEDEELQEFTQVGVLTKESLIAQRAEGFEKMTAATALKIDQLEQLANKVELMEVTENSLPEVAIMEGAGFSVGNIPEILDKELEVELTTEQQIARDFFLDEVDMEKRKKWKEGAEAKL